MDLNGNYVPQNMLREQPMIVEGARMTRSAIAVFQAPFFFHTVSTEDTPQNNSSTVIQTAIAPGVTYANADSDELGLDVVTPSGEILSIDDSRLIKMICEGTDEKNVKLVRSDRVFTDCRPLSLISSQTIEQISTETDIHLDKRRFRANIYFDFDSSGNGFAEDELVGRRFRLGAKSEIMVLERDPLCKMISLDPKTAPTIRIYFSRSPNCIRRMPVFIVPFWWNGF